MNLNVTTMQDASYNKSVMDSGIRIYEICDSSETNPKPDTDLELSLGEFVSSQKLKDVSGCSNLFDVMELKLKVDTNETSIGNIGSMVPNLKKLNLNNSYITSVRDLGTSFNNLTMTWLCRCSLSELDGISSLSSLKELYLAFNEISDLSPLSMLDTLEVLDLESNDVNDIMQVEFLFLCNNLVNLTLKGNPIEVAPTQHTKPSDLKFYSYQDAVLSRLPSLNILDDEPLLCEKVDGKEVRRVNPKKSKGKYTSDLRIIAESLKCLDVDEDAVRIEDSETARPKSAQKRLRSAQSPGHPNEQPESKESDVWNNNTKNGEMTIGSNFNSDLTTGEIMCGNPVTALRQRKRQQNPKRSTTADIAETINVGKKKSSLSFIPEHSYLTSNDINSESKENIFEELKKWRLNNQALFDESNNKDTDIRSNTKRHDQVRPSQQEDTSSTTTDNRCLSKDYPQFSPTPPSLPRKSKTPSRTRRSLPSPPISPSVSDNERPHTVAEFRTELGNVGGEANDLRDSLIKEDEETNFERTSIAPTIQNPVHQLDRPSTARAALQSLRRPYTRTR